MKSPNPTRASAGVLAALTGGIGLFTLAAWGLNRWELVTLGTDYIPMAPITALLFALLAAALAARLWQGVHRPVAWTAHAGVMIATLVSLAELVRSVRPILLPWDGWGFGVETAFGVMRIGQMSPLTAAVFILTILAFAGTGATLAAHRWVRYLANLAALAGIVLGSMVVLAYAAGTPLGYGQGTVPMAWLTATTFLFLNAGILVENEGGGLFHAWRTSEGYSEENRQSSRAFRKQLLIVVVTVFVMAGLVGFYYLRQEQASMRKRVEEQLESIANLKAGQLMEWRRERLGDVRQLAALPDLPASIETLSRDPAGSAALRASVKEYLAAMLKSYSYRQIILLDRNLTPVLLASGETVADKTIPASKRQQIMEAHEPLMNDLHRSTQGVIHVDFIAPIRTKEGDQFAGAVQVSVDPGLLIYPLLQEWPSTSATGETLMVRREGADVLYLNNLRHQAGTALTLRLPADAPTLLAARALRSNQKGLLEGSDYRGVPVLGMVRQVVDTPWFLIAKLDQAEAYEPISADVVTVLGGVFLIAGVVGLSLRSFWQERQRQLANQQLEMERKARFTNERLSHVMQNAGEVILLFDDNMRIVEANQRVQEVYGHTPEQMTRLSAKDLRSPEVADRAQADFSKTLAGQRNAFETIHMRRDGTTFPVEVSARLVEIGGCRHVLSIIRDISLRRLQDEEIARLSRLYYVISQINKTLLWVKTRDELFAAVCRVLVEVGRFRIAWIGWLDEASRRVRPVAVAGDEHGYVDEIGISADPSVPEGRGPSGTALREGRIVVCNDYFTDPMTQPWRERARQSGFKSSIALPFRSEGRTVGLLTVYAGEINFFAPREVELLEETVENMAFALEVFAHEAQREAVETKFRQLFAMVPLPMGHSDAEGRITFANERFYRAFGYGAAEVPTVQAWLERAYPDPHYRDVLAKQWARRLEQAAAGNGEIAPMETSVTCKDGQVRTVEISGMLLAGEMLITFIDTSERVKADKILRQMSRIIEQAPVSIAITDLKGAIEYVNPTFLRVTGYAEAEVLGQNPRVLKSGLTPPAVYSDMWTTLARGEVWSGDLSNKKKNGEIYHERAVIAPVADEAGRVTHYVALKEDVTRSKQMEDELRLSNERFRSMFETNLDGLLITLPGGNIIAANPAACAILGRSESGLIGLGRRDVLDMTDTRLAPLLEERQRTGKARGILTMVRGDGTRFEAEISSAVFGTGPDQRNGLVIRDITDQLRAQEQMRRFNEELEAKVFLRTEEIAAANSQMQALLQSVPDLVLRVDRQGTVLNFQPAKGATPLAEIARTEVAEARTGTAAALRAIVDTVGSKVLAAKATLVEEHELPAPTGPVTVELRAAPVSEHDFVVFARDVTARKRFEAEMAAMLEKEHQVSEMKTRFISVTSHEFRTPMAAALGSVELLTNHFDRLLPAKRFELLARISQALGRMSEMLDEILLLNRMDANRVEVRLAPVDLLPFVRNLLDEIRLGDKAGHVIELETTGETAGFVTDTNLLHHMIGNILSNAVRYSPAGSRIGVRLAVEAATLRFAVEDEGIGIPVEDLQRIFNPFERGSNVGNIKGTGLGLNIVKRMTEMLHGEIAVRSAPTGSCFTLTVPSQPAKTTPS